MAELLLPNWELIGGWAKEGPTRKYSPSSSVSFPAAPALRHSATLSYENLKTRHFSFSFNL